MSELTEGEAAVVWFTGLSGAGKSTLAGAVRRILIKAGARCEVLDGDDVRRDLSRDLGFSANDRNEHVRRVGFLAALLARNGVFTLVPVIAPFVKGRVEARLASTSRGVRFIEVFVSTPLHVCESRDPKGLYARARSGALHDLTGLGSPYERPQAPDLEIAMVGGGVEEAAMEVVAHLRSG